MNVPDGFEYQVNEYMANGMVLASRNISSNLSDFIKNASNFLQPHISPLYNRAHIVFNSPKVRKFFSSEYDLIHSCQSLLDTNLPYVIDFEHPAVFSGYNQYGLDKTSFMSSLTKVLLNRNLKKLLSWSNASKNHLISLVKNKDIDSKIEVIYPIFTPPKFLKKEKHNGITFLFVGKIFFEKGGYETLLAFDRISEKYDSKLIMVAPVPNQIKSRFSKNKKINILGPQPYDVIKQLYLESDVFVFPTHYDTYGFVIPEAFSYGLPVISVDSFSTPELVEHEKTGLIVKSFYSCFRADGGYKYPTIEQLVLERLEATKHPTESYISELSNAMSRLIEDNGFRLRLSINARKESIQGRFSPNRWKKQLGKIYNEAVQ